MKTLVLSVVFAVTSIVNAVNNNSLEGLPTTPAWMEIV